MPPRADTKEHHLCFAYKGERMRSEFFERLKFVNVQGTTGSDGMQLVRISLQKQNGRRAHTIQRVIEQYNRIAAAEINPVAFNTQPVVCCFKLTQHVNTNPILWKIASDKESSSSKYWAWDSGHNVPRPMRAKALLPLIEKTLIEELRTDPSTLPLQRICEEIQAKIDEQHEDSVIDIPTELKKYIGREQMYLVAPAVVSLPPASIFQMDDLVFKDDDDKGKDEDDKPNDTIKAYFQAMLLEWKGARAVSVTAEEVVKFLNRESPGLYRRSCVAAFMRPFIDDGSVSSHDGLRFTIHPARVAEKINA
jgi:hypothetical protein